MILPAIILNDYPGTPFATWVLDKKKRIETRWKKFKFLGDIVICCGNKSDSPNAGLALCIVEIYKVRPMRKKDTKKACIGYDPGRYSYLLRNWGYFDKPFKFSAHRHSGAWQSIFKIKIPKNINII